MKLTLKHIIAATIVTLSVAGHVAAGPLDSLLVRSVAAQEPITAKTILEHMPCQAWTIMHDNDWSGQGRIKIEVEKWTVGYMRDYARQGTERLKKDKPEGNWKNVEGTDVDDRRILSWITAYCMKNPGEPLIKAVFLLFSAFVIVPDHRQLPPP